MYLSLVVFSHGNLNPEYKVSLIVSFPGVQRRNWSISWAGVCSGRFKKVQVNFGSNKDQE